MKSGRKGIGHFWRTEFAIPLNGKSVGLVKDLQHWTFWTADCNALYLDLFRYIKVLQIYCKNNIYLKLFLHLQCRIISLSFTICHICQMKNKVEIVNSPSRLLSLAKPGLWLSDSCDELLNDVWGDVGTSGSSQLPVKGRIWKSD